MFANSNTLHTVSTKQLSQSARVFVLKKAALSDLTLNVQQMVSQDMHWTNLEKVNWVSHDGEEVLPDSHIWLSGAVGDCLQIFRKLFHKGNDPRKKSIWKVKTRKVKTRKM